MTTAPATSEYALVDIAFVYPHPRNVRRTVAGVDELADSIKSGGLHQPLVVAPVDTTDDRAGYTLVMGHRRLAAAQTLGWAEVPCVIRYDLDTDTKVLEAMLAENMARSDLTPTEEGDAFQALLDLDVKPAKIAKAAGRSTKHVKDRAQIAGLADRAREAVDDGQITIADALSLTKLDDDHQLAAQVQAAIGTPNFRYTLERAIQEREFNRKRDKIIADLTEAGATITDGPTPQGDGEIRVFLTGRPEDVTDPTVSVYLNEWQSWNGATPPRVQWIQIRPREDEDPTDGSNFIHRNEDNDEADTTENAAHAALRQEEHQREMEKRAARETAQSARHRWLHEKWKEGMRAEPGVRDDQLRALLADNGFGYSMTSVAARLAVVIGGPDSDLSVDDPALDPAGWSTDKLAFAAWWNFIGWDADRSAARPAHMWDDETVDFLQSLADDYDYPLSDVELELIAEYTAAHADDDHDGDASE